MTGSPTYPSAHPIARGARRRSRRADRAHRQYASRLVVRQSLPGRFRITCRRSPRPTPSRHPELAFIESKYSKVGRGPAAASRQGRAGAFPYIASLADAINHRGPHPPDMFGTVQNPIRMMEIEHQEAGERMVAIREVSHNYAPPADACSTYRLVMDELQAFERDLHRHIDLEDNVLFPAALELEEKTERLGRGLKSQQWERQASGR